MKPEIKTLWITTLRSGEYKQGKANLRSGDDKFCCLGVLCDLWVKEGEGEWNEPKIEGGVYTITDEDSEEYEGGLTIGSLRSGVLPYAVMEWSGIETHSGEYEDGTLTTDNDSGKPFAEIADIIDWNF